MKNWISTASLAPLMASKIASNVAWPLISSRTSLLARHGMRPSFGMALKEAYAVEARAVSASSTHGRQLSSEMALRISSLAGAEP